MLSLQPIQGRGFNAELQHSPQALRPARTAGEAAATDLIPRSSIKADRKSYRCSQEFNKYMQQLLLLPPLQRETQQGETEAEMLKTKKSHSGAQGVQAREGGITSICCCLYGLGSARHSLYSVTTLVQSTGLFWPGRSKLHKKYSKFS